MKVLFLFVHIASVSKQYSCNSPLNNQTKFSKKSGTVYSVFSGTVWSVLYSSIGERANEGEEVISLILDQVGLTQSFSIFQCDGINNAVAFAFNTNQGKERFIGFDYKFLSNINNASGTNWAAVSILAHEIGHHLNAHTFDFKNNPHEKELEADEFSGFILAKLGATRKEAVLAIKIAGNPNGSSSHPPKHQRISAINRGWDRAKVNKQLVSDYEEFYTTVYDYSPILEYPSSSSSTIITVKNDISNKVKILREFDAKFYFVEYGENKGYLNKMWLTDSKTQSKSLIPLDNQSINRWMTFTKSAPIKNLPKVGAKDIGHVLADNNKLYVLKESGTSFYQIKYNERIAYVMKMWAE